MIILLFFDGILAFVANEYAKFFELKIPCLLCTRIDHVLVRRKPDFYYNDSICEAHKKSVSYLAYCHVHKKLSDIRKMCEGCLLSFATEKESDCDTYKSLVGILHKDLECFVEDDHKINLKLPERRKDDAVQAENSSIHCCSCCGDPLKRKSSHSKGFVQGSAATNVSLLSQAPAPSPRASFLTLRNEESRKLELPHIKYMELKFISDSESEIPEDDGGSNAGREDVKAATVPLLTESGDLNEDYCKTPGSARANRFFGIPLTDSATNSPRWGTKLPRKSLLEKTEVVSESMERPGSFEVDGESILYRLKRQVRLDHKSLIDMYMELDEERSASAVAANNAMAMITRLQAEKAAVQMEALQYQRMMEEQAEYDQEALQAMKDLLTKREEEVKVLEAELDAYRIKYGCLTEEIIEESQALLNDDYQELKSQSYSSFSEKSECGSPPFSLNEHNSDRAESLQEHNERETHDASSLDFESERSYLLDRLKYLEGKFHLLEEDGFHSSQSSSDMVDDKEEERGLNSLSGVAGVESKAILANELSYLSMRLKTLEADGGFLRRNSEGTTAVLTEIAQRLWKLQQFVEMPLEDTHA
ncbi:hypothetical protein L1049_028556 [Liquidambar formosana]|uniref:GTD-binding domain-containing protein n=1 Tax=Liquidambar formosana TaxID=63359 RepID=A0AAP0RL41_LIQFO